MYIYFEIVESVLEFQFLTHSGGGTVINVHLRGSCKELLATF